MKNVTLDYTQFKAILVSKALLGQYYTTNSTYELFAIEGNVSWETSILKSSDDGVDFETNHKANYNKPLEVKAGPGRPIRAATSPQPINTIQHFKGYKLTLEANQTSNSIDISFPSLVYVKGGRFYCSEVAPDDHLHADVLLAANDMVLIPNLVENCYLIANTPIPFESAESMALAPEVKLRITFEGSASLTARSVYIVAEYFV